MRGEAGVSSKMKFQTLGGLAALMLAVPSTVSAGVQELETERKAVNVHFADGTSRIYELRYTSYFNPEHHLSGRHYSRSHPIDTRQCRWTGRAYIVRQVCLQAASGQPFCDARWDRTYDRPALKPVPALKPGFSPASCDLAKPRFEPQLAAVRRDVIQALPEIVSTDRDTFLSDDLSIDVAVRQISDVEQMARLVSKDAEAGDVARIRLDRQ